LGRPACASSREGRRHLTCENDRAKPDHISRLACSTNLSKILEGGPPKRYPFWIEVRTRVRLSSNLMRIAQSPACTAGPGVFARTFQSYQSSGCRSRKEPARTFVDNPARTAQKSKSGQQKSLEPIRLAGDKLPGHAMACSLWDSLQGFNGAHRAQLVRPYEPASHFPHI
jgi:hypothetical protein